MQNGSGSVARALPSLLLSDSSPGKVKNSISETEIGAEERAETRGLFRPNINIGIHSPRRGL